MLVCRVRVFRALIRVVRDRNDKPPGFGTPAPGGPSPLAGFSRRFDATSYVARLTSLAQAARLRPKRSVQFFSRVELQAMASDPTAVRQGSNALPETDRRLARAFPPTSHVPITSVRSDRTHKMRGT